MNPCGPNIKTERIRLNNKINPITVGGTADNARITGTIIALGELGTSQGEGRAVDGVVGVEGTAFSPPAELGALLRRSDAELQAEDCTARQAAGVGTCR